MRLVGCLELFGLHVPVVVKKVTITITTDTAMIVHPEEGKRRHGGKGRKRAALANAGKAVFKVLGLPIKTVVGGIRKLLSLATGGGRRRKGRNAGGASSSGGPALIDGGHPPRRPATCVDLDALGAEERALVEETYQGALSVYVCEA